MANCHNNIGFIHKNIGYIDKNNDDYNAATKHYNAAIEHYTKAIEHYAYVNKINRSNGTEDHLYFYNRGNAYYEVERYDEAL